MRCRTEKRNSEQIRVRIVIAVLTATVMVGCADSQAPRSPTADRAVAPTLRREDSLWLERVTFGLTSSSVADFRRLGRQRFLDSQLRADNSTLPPSIAAQIDSAVAADPEQSISAVQAQHRSIDALSDEAAKQQARKDLNEQGNKLAYGAIRRELLRAVYSHNQLQEQMIWFWLNHFSVHQNKAELRWLVGDYEESAIRPYALGHFKDLVLATLEHPAMLEYLDNRQNAAGHINENYARELMELHTLGVTAAYSQQDVQQLARILTGVGINAGNTPKLKPEWKALYIRHGAFEFNPARHDFGTKTLLNHTIEGRGFAEVEDAVALIVAQPACARFISRQIASYFVADDPPPALVERMAQTFTRTNGDIAAVLRSMFLAREFDASLGAKFKDPMRFVVSAVRFAYDDRPISNSHPLLNWLNGLGEAPFGRQTPDGYPLTEISWASSGQMSRRFEIARLIGSGNAGLFDAEDGGGPASGFPQLSNRLYFAVFEPYLKSNTREALSRANSQLEWNTFLLSSPDFNYD